jgi:hypothetical protein
MIWYDIWYDTWYDIWCDMVWYGMIWYDMIYDTFNCNWVNSEHIIRIVSTVLPMTEREMADREGAHHTMLQVFQSYLS